jgi:hypothetical protein
MNFELSSQKAAREASDGGVDSGFCGISSCIYVILYYLFRGECV